MTREQAIHHAARILAASTTGCAADDIKRWTGLAWDWVVAPREQAEAAWTPTSVEQLETLIRQRRQAPAKAS